MSTQRTLPAFHRPDGPTAVTVKIARHATWLIGDQDNGLDGGDFVTWLWRLMQCADQANLELLRAGWPGYVEAFEAQGRTHWGVEWLRDRAKYGDVEVIPLAPMCDHEFRKLSPVASRKCIFCGGTDAELDLGQLADDDQPRIGGAL